MIFMDEHTPLEQAIINEVEGIPDLCLNCDTPIGEGERYCASCHGEGMWVDVGVDQVLLDG